MRPTSFLLTLLVASVGSDRVVAQTALVPVRQTWLVHAPEGALVHQVDTWGADTGPGHAPLSYSPNLRWQFQSDGTWIAEAAAIAGRGTRVVTEYGSFDNRVSLLSGHDVNPPSPVWEDTSIVQNLHREVRAAADSEVFVSLHQEPAGTSGSQRNAVLRKYTLASGAPDWVFVSPILINNHNHSAVRATDDGSRIVLAVYDFFSASTKLTVFDQHAPTPIDQISVSTLGPFQVFALSNDGSTAVLGSTLRLTFVDLTTSSVSHVVSLGGAPQYGATAISADGEVVAFGTLHQVRIYRRGASGGYELAHTHPLPPANYAIRVALSRDGSTLVIGSHALSNGTIACISALDVATGSLLMSAEVVGSGPLQNLVADLSVSNSGHRFAVGLWGDEAGLVPRVLVYRRDSSMPILSEYLPGSVSRLELAPDGNSLVVASKGVHASVLGGGGAITLYDVGRPDLELIGAPRAGSTIWVRHRLRAGNRSQVLTADQLADTPTSVPSIGDGLLFLDPASIASLPGGVAGDEGAWTSYDVPAGVAEIGRTIYLQALDLDEQRLSRSWIPLTILP